MKKRHGFPFRKRFLAGLLAVLCMAGSMSGCKIEFPDDVAADPPPVSGSASFTTETDASAPDNSSSPADVPEPSGHPDASQASDATSDSSAENGGDRPTPSSAASPSSSQATPPTAPKPVEPEDAEVDEEKPLTCTMSITCKTILDNIDLFNKDKLGVLPKDGVIYAERTVTFYEGESVFDILVRETKKNRIHMEHQSFPMYNSEYIEGIHNLYQKDCGEGSGWMYRVNGWFPNYGCSRYQVKPGDKIEWVYTCDLGHDIGGGLGQ